MSKQSGEDGWWQFLELCAGIKKAEDLDEFFTLFLTIEERATIAGRSLIVRELLKGERTQREIAEEQQVSIAKITRGSNSLKIVGEKLRKYILAKVT